jgi:hypothetical protein
MALDMVLNDLSFIPASDVLAAKSQMAGLVQTVKSAMLHGVKGALRTRSSLYGTILSEGYQFERWANDRTVNADERLFLLRLTTRSPYWLGDILLENRVGVSECCFDWNPAMGLGVAFLLDTLAVSLASNSIWDEWLIPLNCAELTTDGDISYSDEVVHHASAPLHVEQNATWIQQRLRGDLHSGRELWDRREEVLPSLEFCPGVQTQLETLAPELLSAVVRHLSALQTYCSTWTSGGFNKDAIPLTISVESESTLARFGAERTFVCHDGIPRTFSLHTKGTPGPFRIYLLAEAQPGKLTIGYIGPHLPTARFK